MPKSDLPLAAAPAFPVRLVCNACGTELRYGNACSCPAGTRLEDWNGVPRTLFGQNYWGECTPEKMGQILERLDEVHWSEALQDVAGGEPVCDHLLHRSLFRVGPDVVYSFPWDRISNVLDIGAGMGFFSAELARFGKPVVSLEAVPERALFLAKRARQDGFDNLTPIIASATAMPFEPGSFDLITLNGVFEYIGLWGQGDPRRLQEQFLVKLRELLRPGGILYIGIETRFGSQWWLGGRDHSGLKYTSLMPRLVADLYCRIRNAPFYGSQKRAGGYRTYTYTPRQYETMLRAAGFGPVEVRGCFPGYNIQHAIYPLDSAQQHRSLRLRILPPLSRLGKLRRAVTDSKILWRVLEEEVLLLAGNGGDDGRIAWPTYPLAASETVVQLNRQGKVFLVTYRDETPTILAKAGKDHANRTTLDQEVAFLHRAARLLPADLPVSPHKYLDTQEHNGLTFHRYEYANGPQLASLVASRCYQPQLFVRRFAELIDGYTELRRRLSEATGTDPVDARNPRDELADMLQGAAVDDATVRERIADACRQLREGRWAVSYVHGDLSVNNAIMTEDGRMILVDWENASTHGLPALDLIGLLYSAWSDTTVLPPKVRAEVMATSRARVADALSKLGVTPDDIPSLAALFVAHHAHAKGETAMRNGLRALSDSLFQIVASDWTAAPAPSA